MRKIIIGILLSLTITVSATNRYFSSFNGDDENSGLTSSSPRQSLIAIQYAINNSSAGDTIFLEAASVWYQSVLTITSKTIVFKKYNPGVNPIISGGKIISVSNIGGNLWKGIDVDLPDISITRRCLASVTINWDYLRIGQEPDSGFYGQVTSGSTDFLTDNTQNWPTNHYAGGYVSCRRAGGSYDWDIFMGWIATNNSNTLTLNGVFTDDQGANPSGDWVYYNILNHKNTLDNHREWSHQGDSLWLYWTDGTPGIVRASIVDTIFKITSSTVNFYDIDITDANYYTLNVTGSTSDIALVGCKIGGAGRYGIRNENGGKIVFRNGEIIWVDGGVLASFSDGGCRIDSNKITFLGINLLKNRLDDGFEGSQLVLWRDADDTLYIRNNYMDKVVSGVQQHNSSKTYSAVEITGNFVNSYGFITGDRGWFYSVWDVYYDKKRKIHNNFLLNGHSQVGALGENLFHKPMFHCFYFDEQSPGFEADSNTITNTNLAAQINQSYYVKFRYNNIYNANKDITNDTWSAMIFNDSVVFSCPETAPGNLTDNTITYNTIVMDNISGKYAWGYHACGYRLPPAYTQNNNRYVTDFGASDDLFFGHTDYTTTSQEYTLSEFQAATGLESGSSVFDMSMDSTRIFMNWSMSEHEFELGSGVYKDASGSTFSGTLTVPKMYSKILFLINSDESGRDDLIYMDSFLVPYLSMDEPETFDTIWFKDYNFGNKVTTDQPICSETAVIFESDWQAGSDVRYEYCTAAPNDNTDIYDVQWRSQTLTVGTVSTNENHNITSVKILAYKVGNPGTLTVYIRNIASGDTPGSTTYSTGTVNANDFTTNTDGAWYEIDMSAYNLQPSTKYAIVLLALGGNSSNKVVWLQDYNNPYAGGAAAYSSNSGGSWAVESNVDHQFEIWSTSDPTGGGDYNSWVKFEDIDFGSHGVDSVYVYIEHVLPIDSISTNLILNSLTGDTIANVIVTGSGCRISKIKLPEVVTGVHDLYATVDSLDSYVWISFKLYHGAVKRIPYNLEVPRQAYNGIHPRDVYGKNEDYEP